MNVWEYEGAKYQIVSMYLVPEDAWTYELTGQSPGSGIAVVIPDAAVGHVGRHAGPRRSDQ